MKAAPRLARCAAAALCAALPLLACAEGAEAGAIAALREQARAFEDGQGVARDALQAAALYCQAARLGDAASQYDLGWMYAYGRGVPRDDALAAFFFRAAAEQGVVQATNMLPLVGEPAEAPACMRDPEPVVAEAPPAAPVALPAAPKPIVDLVESIAPRYNVATPLALAIIEAESNFDPAAISPKNAQGLMQLIPETAARFRVKNPFDPAQNIRGGVAYLRWLLAYFEGDVALVAAAYNAGERTVERYRGVPPYSETRAYVQRILSAVGAIAQPFDPSVTAPSAQLRAMRPR
jgi:soluble lytic murein transglycosylase-like protein